MAKKSKIAKALREPKFPVRRERRCKMCGRPRAVYRKFGICRICFRNLADQGMIPGVRKSSWQRIQDLVSGLVDSDSIQTA